MHFGFSYMGLIYLVMLMLPNILWTKNQPKDYDKYACNENKILPWSLWLVASFVLMVLYEVFWIRYFRSEKTMKDFYSSILGIPVAGATLPVLAFLLLAIYGKNIILGCAVFILGIGHIGIHLMHRKEIES